MQTDPVLVAGAGPTGMVLALNLARRGVPVRIVDKAAGPGERSRAMAVQARTLEFYRQLGFADEVVAAGIVVRTAHLREADRGGGSHEVLRVNLRDLGEGLSPYPFVLTYPQDEHERFLAVKLAEAGIAVERNTALTTFTQDDGGVTATLAAPNGSQAVRASYVCGCDGAHSAVRHVLGVGFAGLTYEQLFFVCDAKVAGGSDSEFYVTLGERALVLMFPIRSTGMRRLIGLVPPELSLSDALTFEEIRAGVEALLDARVENVNWFSAYRVHHRVAERFRIGRAFILGDAAHIHSPAGGQGMNTGVGDAVNLGWKLANVLSGRASPRVLDSFEEERIEFARALVATTDRAFTSIVAGGAAGEIVRRVIAPLFLTIATRFTLLRHEFFRTISQTRVHYADSGLSEGEAGGVHGGDRLPWVASVDNFAPLRSLDWQVHVFGECDPELARACESHGVPLHVFSWTKETEHAGFARDAAYLVRPDGYVGLAAAKGEHERLGAYASRIGLRPGGALPDA